MRYPKTLSCYSRLFFIAKGEEGDSDKALPSVEKEMESPTQNSDEMKSQKEEAYILVLPEDQHLISNYLYLTLEQIMEPFKLMDADLGCYKGRARGFPGLACKHCIGKAGDGRYFPATEESLYRPNFMSTLLRHVMKCRSCSLEIHKNVEVMIESEVGPDGKKKEKPKLRGRTVFLHGLRCRIQCLSIDELAVEVNIGRQKVAKGPLIAVSESKDITDESRSNAKEQNTKSTAIVAKEATNNEAIMGSTDGEGIMGSTDGEEFIMDDSQPFLEDTSQWPFIQFFNYEDGTRDVDYVTKFNSDGSYYSSTKAINGKTHHKTPEKSSDVEKDIIHENIIDAMSVISDIEIVETKESRATPLLIDDNFSMTSEDDLYYNEVLVDSSCFWI